MSKRTKTSTPSFEDYGGSAPEKYERYFVPAIGEPFGRDLLEAAAPGMGERMIDVACGTGVIARAAADAVGPTGTVTGLDANPGMLAVARSVCPDTIEWCEASAERIPLPEDAFDLATCQLSLQFFEDKPAALREIRRVVRGGGRLALNVPGLAPEVFRIMGEALARHVQPELAGFVDAVFSLGDPDALGGLIADAGFGDVDARAYTRTLRFDDPAAFLWEYVHSTPLADAVAEADDASRSEVERDVVAGWEPFIEDGALVLDQGVVLATARSG